MSVEVRMFIYHKVELGWYMCLELHNVAVAYHASVEFIQQGIGLCTSSDQSDMFSNDQFMSQVVRAEGDTWARSSTA